MNLRKQYKEKTIEQQIIDTKLKINALQKDENYFKNLEKIQNKCDHNFIPDGHDSHKTYYKCIICGYLTKI